MLPFVSPVEIRVESPKFDSVLSTLNKRVFRLLCYFITPLCCANGNWNFRCQEHKPTRRFAPCRPDVVYCRCCAPLVARPGPACEHATVHTLLALRASAGVLAHATPLCKVVGRSDIPILIDRLALGSENVVELSLPAINIEGLNRPQLGRRILLFSC